MFMYCWFAGDVMAAMLVVKDKSISHTCELKPIFMLILRKYFYCLHHRHSHLVTWLQTKNYAVSIWYPKP